VWQGGTSWFQRARYRRGELKRRQQRRRRLGRTLAPQTGTLFPVNPWRRSCASTLCNTASHVSSTSSLMSNIKPLSSVTGVPSCFSDRKNNAHTWVVAATKSMHVLRLRYKYEIKPSFRRRQPLSKHVHSITNLLRRSNHPLHSPNPPNPLSRSRFLRHWRHRCPYRRGLVRTPAARARVLRQRV